MIAEAAHKRRGMHDLPTDLLAGVLQHVNQEQRLTCCALVCKKWRQAANTATCTVVAARNGKRCLQNLSAWLSNSTYINGLHSIRVKHKAWPSVAPMLQLPFQQLMALNTLRLPSCLLKAAPEDQTAFPASPCTTASSTRAAGKQGSSLAALTALSRLRLGHTLLDLSELQLCTGLQHLELYYDEHMTAAMNLRAAGRAADNMVFSASSAWRQLAVALPQLTQLTCLAVKLHNMEVPQQSGSLTSTVSLSSLQTLEQLRLGITSSSPIKFTHLPSSLTLLELSRSLNLDVCIPPSMQQLMKLQHLHLTRVWDSTLMSSLTNLTWLSIEEDAFDTADAINMLMGTLERLEQLRHLNLAFCLSRQNARHLPPPPTYAALAASSYLTFLDIRKCCFPAGVDKHIFPAADGLKGLKVLALPQTSFDSAGSYNRMVACCPALEQLSIVSNDWWEPPPARDFLDFMVATIHQDVDHEEDMNQNMQKLSALSHLTALTKLTCKVDLNDGDMKSIAACSQLKEVMVKTTADMCDYVSVTGLKLLTQLTALSKLKLSLDYEERSVSHLLVSECSPPDVHLQLQQLIAEKMCRWPYSMQFGEGDD